MEPHTEVVDDKENTVWGDKEGYLEMKKKSKLSNKWKAYWFCLVEGSLFYYGHYVESKPRSAIQLKEAKLQPNPPNAFSIIAQTSQFELRSKNQSEIDSWIAALTAATLKSEGEVPIRDPTDKNVRTDMFFKAKKNTMGKVATSKIGKQGMKKLANEESMILITSVKKIIARISDEKKSDEMERNIIKIILKGWLQYDLHNITVENFIVVDQPLREAFTLIDKLFGYYGLRRSHTLRDGFVKVVNLLKKVEGLLTELLQPHLQPKNMMMMHNTFDFIASVEFFSAVWDDGTLEEELFYLVSSMNRYTQFEYSL